MGIENPSSHPPQEKIPHTDGAEGAERSDAETLEERERALRSEIAEGVEELGGNIEHVQALAEDENLTPSLRKRLLTSIDTISNRIQSRFLKHLGGTAVLTGILGLQEYLINTEKTIVQEGSILGEANEVVLAGLAVYATIKGMQFAQHKMREHGVRKGIDKGTVEGAAGAASYITNEGDYAGVDRGELDVSHAEHMRLYDEHEKIFKEEHPRSPTYPGEKEEHARWKRAMDRIRTESSEALANR